MFPDTTSEVLSHLLNVLYTGQYFLEGKYRANLTLLSGSTETSSDKVQLLCGSNGVFATAKLLGIDIKADQKVIEVVDRSEGPGPAAPFTRHLMEENLGTGADQEEEEGPVSDHSHNIVTVSLVSARAEVTLAGY